MITKSVVNQLINEKIMNTSYFLVDTIISPKKSIIVEIDSNDGVDIDFCVELSRFLQDHLGEELGEYDLEVGSAGLTSPFKVLKQYLKNIDNQVEVLTRSGQKIKGLLKSADEDKFTVETEKMERREGDKRKCKYIESKTYTYNEIKYTKYII